MEETKNEPKAAATTESVDDFFSAKDSNKDLKHFLTHMKQPVEEIEAPPIFQKEEEVPEADQPVDTPDPADEEMAQLLDYTEEHRLTAEFMLIQLDKGLAFALSMISGADMDRYRRRQVRNKADDYELEIAAALVKKYQMRLSLEWMLATALIMGYTPMINKAIGDRQKANRAKAREQENRS